MNARRARTGAAAAAVAAALLLAGCGGDDGGSSSGDKIEGAQSGNEDPTTEPSADDPGAPEFDLPDDVEVEIAADETGDKKKDEVLRYHGYALMAQQEAYAATEPTPNFEKFWDDVAAGKMTNDFATYRKDGITITGLDRFYFREVVSIEGTTAVVAACEDQSKAYVKDVETGKVEKTDTTLKSYVGLRSTMEKTADGWKVVDYTATRGSEECRDKA